MNKALRPIAAIVPAALGYYLYQVQRSISGVKTSTITVIDNAPPVCVNSKAFATVNPCGYTGTHDSRTIVISPSPSRTSISDEQILSDLVRGVFGGWVFAPERWVLQALHRKLVGFSRLPGFNEAESIWTCQQLGRRHLPSPGSILFGTFQVIDINIGNENHDDDIRINSGEIYIDIGFGSDGSRFSGFHRFSVSREQTTAESATGSTVGNESTCVRITFSAFACNPSKNRSSSSGILRLFHKSYAMLLFREGVAKVLEA